MVCQQFTYGVVSEGVFAESLRKFCWQQKFPERIFLGKCCLQKYFLVFSCLAARPVKAYIALPMRITL